MNNPIKITFNDLWTYDVKNYKNKLSISKLNCVDITHIHGTLNIYIYGRKIPYLGYFGENDVCFNSWCKELANIAAEFKNKKSTIYIYDEGEQGQPAFRFEKTNKNVSFSIIDSKISDGEGDPDWQNLKFNYRDFLLEYYNFKEKLLKEISSKAPQILDFWQSIFTE